MGNFTNISKKFGKTKNKLRKFFLLILIQCSPESYPTNKNYALNRVLVAKAANAHGLCVCVCVCVCVCARALTQCATSGHCACSTHAKCGPLTTRGHTRVPLLVLASDLDSSSLKTQDLTIKLWG